MPAKSAFSVLGLAHKMCLAAEEQGYTPELINTLAEHPTLLRDMLQVQLGLAEITYPEHIINCAADPFVPKGWSIAPESEQISSRVRGSFRWNPAEVQLYFSNHQREDRVIKGDKLRKELEDKPVLDADVLDYLLAHPHLIPEEWKGKFVFFWGTIYRDRRGSPCVRCLYWYVGGWLWSYYWLGFDWDGFGPASLRAS